MALPPVHLYQIFHAPNVVASIAVNDIPFYRRFSDINQSPAGPFNHLMLVGENEVELQLDSVEPDPFRQRTFEFNVIRESDQQKLFGVQWPDLYAEHPAEERKTPIKHVAKFVWNEESPKPVWVDAPREGFGPEGTAEQRAAVAELHDAYARQDIDAFLKALELKTAEFIKFYGPKPDLAPEAARVEYGAQLRQDWDLRPLDFKDIVFENRAGGRVAYARHKEGGPALFAQHKTIPNETWEANLLLTRHDGRWRIFW